MSAGSSGTSGPRPVRVLFFSHYFHPEGNAPATRVHQLCRRWAARGHRVSVVTCAPNVPSGVVYPGYANRLLQREEVDGIDTIRVWTYLAANKGTLRRILSYVSYMLSAVVAGLLLRRPDVVIATSPQFFCGWAGVWVSRLRRVPLLLEVRDLWPESIVAVGAMRARFAIRFLEFLERRLYAAAHLIVTVGDGYARQLEARGVPGERIVILPNGVDRDQFRPVGDVSEIRARYGLGDGFVCAYVGTIGMGCGLDVVLRAARRLRDEGRTDMTFLLVGDGAVREDLEAHARRDGLDRVLFTGRLDKQRVPEILSASDACLVHLARRDLFRSVLPSKIFEAAAMARPIVLGVEGSAAELVAGAGAGICIRPDDDAELVDAVKRLADDPQLARKLGEAGRDQLAVRFDWSELASRYAEVLEAVAGRGASR